MSASKSKSQSLLESRLESLIPIVHPRWKQTVVILPGDAARVDSPKGRIGTNVMDCKHDDEHDDTTLLCQICSKSNDDGNAVIAAVDAKYKCPKCWIPYCSVACYQRHGPTCTESFYRTRVLQEMNVGRHTNHDTDVDGDDSQTMRRILNRVHEQQQEQHGQQDEAFQDKDDDDDDDDDFISTADLEQIQKALEQADGDDIHLQLSPELLAAFERDVQAGNVNHLIKQWNPWWRSSIVAVEEIEKHNTQTDYDNNDDDDDTMNAMDLDERILQIPPLSQLIHSPPPNLSFNLISILHAISQTLILFAGPMAAQCIEAAETLVHSSPVLLIDERYDSLPQVLMALQEQTNNHDVNNNNNNNYHYTDDIAELLSNPRHVAHALLDGIQILQYAARPPSPTKTRTTTTRTPIQIPKSERVLFQKIRKKLEFYLSWSRGARQVELRELAAEVRAWNQDWALVQRQHDLQTLKLS